MSQPKLSIIIPVYNGEKFIIQLLNSLMYQLVSNIEVIVVDDGCEDATVPIIIKNFFAFHTKKTTFNLLTKQSGVSAARNLGISKAKGEFIAFIDADDMVLRNYVQEVMHAISIQPEIDIIEFGYKTFHKSINEINFKRASYSNNQFGRHPMSSVIDKVYSTARWYPWTRVFRADLFRDIRFPVGVSFCEDLMTIPQVYEKAHHIFALKEALYAYRVYGGSATYNVNQVHIKKLSEFYDTIPKSNLIRHIYFRFSVAYAIYSCQIKLNGDWLLPEKIQHDLYQVPLSFLINSHFSFRKTVILFYPFAYQSMKKIVGL